MDKYINYYNVLGIRKFATAKEIKLAYYKISKESHPDLGGNEEDYKEITEAYKILSNKESKEEYDTKSKFGNNYSEFNEIYDFEFKNDAKNYDRDKYDEFVRRDQLNILVYIDDTFDGNVEYERWVYCKVCNGSGTDNSAKVPVGFSKNIDIDGKLNYLELSDECDFCDGTGKWGEIDCFYCIGTGKINGSKCLSCNGEKRMLGKQKLSGIKIDKDDKDYKIEQMGNVSRDVPGKTGQLWLIKKKS